jgi:hypothetical protein
MHDHQGFESFRRERNKRRMEGGPLRPLGQNASILRELEEAEAKEVRNQQLTREVHEFFAEATRQAASIVTHVTENAEAELHETVAHEMAEFLADSMRRVQMFVELVKRTSPPGIATQDLDTNMQNIVGQVLDEFRFAGDVTTAEAHVGQDPFATDTGFGGDLDDRSQTPQGGLPAWTDDGPAEIEEHLVAELLGRAPAPQPEPAEGIALRRWFERLCADDEQLKATLKLLVRSEVMSKDEARAIYRER